MPQSRAVFPAALQMNDARQSGQQWIEWPRVTTQEAANDLGAFAPAAIDRNRDWQRTTTGALVRRDVELGAHAGRARDHVRITLRKDDDVPRVQPKRRFAEQAAPARAGGDDVVFDHVLDAGHDVRRYHGRGRRFGNPRFRSIDREEYRAGETHRA